MFVYDYYSFSKNKNMKNNIKTDFLKLLKKIIVKQ